VPNPKIPHLVETLKEARLIFAPLKEQGTLNRGVLFAVCGRRNCALLEDFGTLGTMQKNIVVGSNVIARLYDGRVVVAKVTAIVDSIIGRKIHISFGPFAFKLDQAQIIRVV
jgi:hypothetical protein